MKFLIFALVLFATLTAAANFIPNKYILMFNEDTVPEATVEKVKSVIKSKGGKIGFEYSFIKGFAFSAPDQAVKFLQDQKEFAKFPFTIEQDQVVSLNDQNE